MERLRKRPLPHFIKVTVSEDNMGSLVVKPLERTEEFSEDAYLQFEDAKDLFWEEAAPHTSWSIKTTKELVSRGWDQEVFISDEYAECLLFTEGEYV